MNATIFDIHRMSFVDGPGIRTTVFFKGCNLNCRWCHNPESQSACKQRLMYLNKCKHCGKCKDVCPHHLEKCDLCGLCAMHCPNNAIEICGEEISVESLLAEIMKDKVFYDNANGGVTFSGGECMLQIDFLQTILHKCKESGIQTAVDTAGNVSWERFEQILPDTDLFLYDIKTMDSAVHKAYIGVGNERILENLSQLLRAEKRVWIRVPIIPSVNDTVQEMECIRRFFEVNGYPEKTELLPYHKMGEHKYAALGRTAQVFDVPDDERIEQLYAVLCPDRGMQ